MIGQGDWEVFKGRATRPGDEPIISISTHGAMSLSRSAWDALGKPEAVELLYKRGERLVGLRAAEDPTARHAYPLRPVDRASTHVLSFVAFAQRYGIAISPTVSRRYVAEMRGNILTIDLNATPLEVADPRRGKPRAPRKGEQAK
jgi:hypothetical protein